MSISTGRQTGSQNPQDEAALAINSSEQERPLLEVRGLSTGYGETQVLWDISLDIMRGEVAALVGANSAGKSTLLATICG